MVFLAKDNAVPEMLLFYHNKCQELQEMTKLNVNCDSTEGNDR
jgi:hypothetical protein